MNHGLYAGEIDSLASRMLGDVTPYFATAEDARQETKTRYVPAVSWLGVFARDQLPPLQELRLATQERRPFALVFNTDPADRKGTHWLAMFGPSDGPLELFDSFALHPSLYSLVVDNSTSSSSSSSTLVYSRTPLQSLSSAVCGQYCLYFLHLRSHRTPFHFIVRQAKKALVPDRFVYDYVHRLQLMYRVLNPCRRLCTGQCCQMKCSFC